MRRGEVPAGGQGRKQQPAAGSYGVCPAAPARITAASDSLIGTALVPPPLPCTTSCRAARAFDDVAGVDLDDLGSAQPGLGGRPHRQRHPRVSGRQRLLPSVIGHRPGGRPAVSAPRAARRQGRPAHGQPGTLNGKTRATRRGNSGASPVSTAAAPTTRRAVRQSPRPARSPARAPTAQAGRVEL